MTEQETINNEVRMKLALQDAKFNQFMEEMKDFKNEMRERDNRRADEISELRHKNDELSAKIDDKFERLLNQIQNMAIAAVVGVGAVVAAVVSIMK